MAANTLPIFGLTPVIGQVSIAVANAARDGTGTIATLKTGTVNGSRIDFVVVKAIVTTTAGVIRLYIDDGAGNIFLWDELLVSAVVPSGTAAAFRGIIPVNVVLPSGFILKISTDKAETFRCFAHGADY